MIIIIIIIIEKVGYKCKAGRERLKPYQFEDTSPSIPVQKMREMETLDNTGEGIFVTLLTSALRVELLLHAGGACLSFVQIVRCFRKTVLLTL